MKTRAAILQNIGTTQFAPVLSPLSNLSNKKFQGGLAEMCEVETMSALQFFVLLSRTINPGTIGN